MHNFFLPEKLRELRKANGYTQDYVASALNIARQTYSHYETGKRIPNSITIYKLAGLYDIPVDDLMHLTIKLDENDSFDMPTPTQSSLDMSAYLEYLNNPNNRSKLNLLNRFEKELLYYFGQISDDDKKEIIEFTKIKAHKN